ncbi:hypothetical protein LWI29_025787 [Acer saccharum]|uniref:Diacylglycerol O-acyltransferase n=1 Tax=Acer saccharum TaxID=4024 RepID=A0AA39RT66_ACESA|nr:hypothetical protein LWI29_025787 [Acer saccharum]
MGDLKPIKVKANVEEVLMEKYEEGGGEPLSPMARIFHEPDSNIYIITMIGSKTQINPQVIKANLPHTLLRHPRFSSVQVMDENSTGLKWVPTTVDLDNHVIVPKFEPNNIHTPDKIVEDYISNLSKSTIKMSIPMWDLHLLNLKTAYAESTAVFRIHHSLGDGTSLMSLLLASTRKVSDPQTLPTLPMMKKANSTTKSSGGFLGNYFIKLWLVLSLFWNTSVDVSKFLATVFMFLKDTETPLKGGLGNGATTSRRFVHRMVSLDDVKLVKNAMNIELADMMKKNSFARWGNHIGYVLFPFTIALRDDPLDYLREAKAKMDRKKASLEAPYSYFMAKYFLKFCGLKWYQSQVEKSERKSVVAAAFLVIFFSLSLQQSLVMATENTQNFVQPSIPRFDGHYDHWSMLMENFLKSKEYWQVVDSGVAELAEVGALEWWNIGSISNGSGPVWYYTGPPVPSRELGHGLSSKVGGSWFLEWRAPREAGFTEQRSPSALGSGRITGRCLLGPIWSNGLT